MVNWTNLQTRLQELARTSIKRVVAEVDVPSPLLSGVKDEASGAEAIQKYVAEFHRDFQKKLLSALSEAIRSDETVQTEKEAYAQIQEREAAKKHAESMQREQERKREVAKEEAEKERRKARARRLEEVEKRQKAHEQSRASAYRAYALVFTQGVLSLGAAGDGGLELYAENGDCTVAVGGALGAVDALTEKPDFDSFARVMERVDALLPSPPPMAEDASNGDEN